MYDWQAFDAVFHTKADISPDQKHVDAVLRHRKELDGTLFFDRMWTNVKLKQREYAMETDRPRLILF